jgi:amidohydrolase
MNFANRLVALVLLISTAPGGDRAVAADVESLESQVRKNAAAIEDKLIVWRREIHEHPELGDQEVRTSRLVATHLRDLGLEVRTGVARTGVVGILNGGKPGRTVALRADMDALPVKEPAGLPFASKATAIVDGKKVPLMHACGHDTHTAMLMATAQVLTSMKDELPGKVVFIFQPAEEGSNVVAAGSGKSWGAKRMLEEGLFEELKPDAVFAIHVMPGPLGEVSYRSGPVTASGDSLAIRVAGKQGHGGMPWNTIDPITTSALVISGLQTVVSRRADLTASPVVVTIGTIHGGSRGNIVADSVEMTGTIRTYREQARNQAHHDITRTAEKIAESAQAKAEVSIHPMYDVTVNDPALTARMAPVLEQATDGRTSEAALAGASEDFSFFAQKAPGLYVFLGVTPPDQDPAKVAPNHNPNFFVDERALVVRVRTMSYLAVNFLASEPNSKVVPTSHRRFYQDELSAGAK